jgi:putative acetyltransferase
MDNLVIRKVKHEDNATLAKIIRAVFDEHAAPQKNTVYSDPTTDDLYNLSQQTGAVLWVADLDGETLGCCGIFHTNGLEEDVAELAKFYLPEKIRGKGIGKQLMLQCFLSAKEMGYRKLYIESLPQFSKAVSMYEKYGFKKIDKPLGSSGHTSCNIWMIKDIADV